MINVHLYNVKILKKGLIPKVTYNPIQRYPLIKRLEGEGPEVGGGFKLTPLTLSYLNMEN